MTRSHKLRCFLTSGYKPDLEIARVEGAEPGYYRIYHPELKDYCIVPADQLEFREEEIDIGDLL